VAGVPADVAVEPAGREEVRVTLADTAWCERLLGFRPQTDLVALVRRQAAALDRVAPMREAVLVA
jgi:hypothetical protein